MKKSIIIGIIIICYLLTSYAYAYDNLSIEVNDHLIEFTKDTGAPFIKSGRTLVPLRVVVESLDAEVRWDNELRQAIVIKNDITIKVPIDKAYIYKDNKKILNDSKATIINGRTYLPIRVVMESFGYQVDWNGNTRSILINDRINKELKNGIVSLHQKLTINNRSIQINGYKIDLKNENVKVETALAKAVVGQTDTLKNIAEDNDAIIAINGSYFAAYDESEIKDPYGILVVNGEAVHNSNKRATIGFRNNEVDIDYVDTQIKGSNGTPTWQYSWNGYWLNHTVIKNGVSLTVYDENRGTETYSELGKNYIVENGIITKIVDNQSVKIPENGYVANLYGILGTTPSQVYDRFKIGYPFSYDVTFQPDSGRDEFWNNLEYATGAGPALMINGKINIDYEKEGFFEKKITEYSSARSAIGYTKDNQLIMITTVATIDELAHIMKTLGCIEAMNLDGGASSGLYFNGQYIKEPGREISNIIYIK